MEDDKLIVTKDLIHERQTQTHLIEVPQWGGWVRCKLLKVRERGHIFDLVKPGEGKDHNLMLLIVEKSLVEPEMTRDELEEADAAAIDHIATQLMKLNGWSKEGQEALAKDFSS